MQRTNLLSFRPILPFQLLNGPHAPHESQLQTLILLKVNGTTRGIREVVQLGWWLLHRGHLRDGGLKVGTTFSIGGNTSIGLGTVLRAFVSLEELNTVLVGGG